MKTIYLNQQSSKLPPSVATIGFFDGVHLGHRFLMEELRKVAAAESLLSMVITFDRHPREVLGSDYQPKLLSTLDEKLALLSQTGIDVCAVLSFSRELAALSAREFMAQVLLQKLHVKKLFIGYDNRFGHNRAEGFDDYVRYGRELGIEVVQSPAFQIEDINVSSSVVRAFVSEGEMAMAARCLGQAYSLTGHVVDGFHEGRRLGFPTANIEVSDAHKLIPAPGVYAVKVHTEQEPQALLAMMNIGTRPTYEGRHEQTLEVHIIGFSGNLYGQQLTVSFIRRLRDEKKFESLEALRRQLLADEKMVSEINNNQE